MKKDKNKYHHGDLKNALIKAGLEILKEKGIDALSLRAVAKKSNVSHSAPYSHFPDKKALLIAIAEVGFNKFSEGYDDFFQNYKGNYYDFFNAFIKKYINFALSNQNLYLLMFSGIISSNTKDFKENDKIEINKNQIQDELYIASMKAFNHIVSLVKLGQKSNYIKNSEAFSLAMTIWVSMHGMAVLLINDTLPAPPDFEFTEENVKNIPNTLTDVICENLLKGLIE